MIVHKIDQRDVASLRGLERGKWFRSARNINLPRQTSLQVI